MTQILTPNQSVDVGNLIMEALELLGEMGKDLSKPLSQSDVMLLESIVKEMKVYEE